MPDTTKVKCTCCHQECDEVTWPGDNGEICQLCWEAQCSREFWQQMGRREGDPGDHSIDDLYRDYPDDFN